MLSKTPPFLILRPTFYLLLIYSTLIELLIHVSSDFSAPLTCLAVRVEIEAAVDFKPTHQWSKADPSVPTRAFHFSMKTEWWSLVLSFRILIPFVLSSRRWFGNNLKYQCYTVIASFAKAWKCVRIKFGDAYGRFIFNSGDTVFYGNLA